MQRNKPRFIITRGVIDMATSMVLSREGYRYGGPMALADDPVLPANLKTAISAELDKHFQKTKEVIKAVQDDLDANKRVSEGVKDAVAKLNTDGAKLVAEHAEKERKQDETILDLQQKLAEMGKRRPGSDIEGKSIGQQFVESDQFKGYVETGQRTGKSASPPWQTKTSLARQFKNITSISNVGGAGIFPEFLPTPVIPAFQPITFRDLLASGTTNSNAIIWVQESVFIDNAGYQGSDGSLKPQSDLTYIQQNIAVVTIAHWMKASKQVLADFPMLQTLIDNRLAFGLKLKEEQELLYGDGAAHHLHGVVPQATAYNQGYLSTDTKIDTIRRAMLQTTLAFYPATGIAMGPADWADIQLTKDSFGRYMIGNPTSTMPAMLWGLPVAECFSMQRGDFIVGALKLAATVFDRQDAAILLSTEDQDNFVRNMVTILTEERLALGVSRPQAIIYGDFKAGETG